MDYEFNIMVIAVCCTVILCGMVGCTVHEANIKKEITIAIVENDNCYNLCINYATRTPPDTLRTERYCETLCSEETGE